LFGQRKNGKDFFDSLCETYYEKVLRYLFLALGDETAARDCTQDVFLTACQKLNLLQNHPNPGGFLFQTAKNLARKVRRESFQRFLHDEALGETNEPADTASSIENILDKQIDEQAYIDLVLSRLSEEKRGLYAMYYLNGKTMSEVAEILGATQTAVRMRYVRLRREIQAIVDEISSQCFGT